MPIKPSVLKQIALEMGSKVIAEIPFDHNVNDALMTGKTVIEYGKGPALGAIVSLWGELNTMIKKGV